ncbi:MAG: endonuclease/exonuclease/phosphatase family protein [Anaerolineae bacterium]|nr:endonuclease/exonuclease/phosphatase family protein [Anaerolineae bacterium]
MLQVVTLNIGGNRHFRNTPLNPPLLAREIHEIIPIDPTKPTLIALQEASQVWYQPDQLLDTGSLLALEFGFEYKSYYGTVIDSETHPHRRAWNRDPFAGAVRASEGNAIITNLPLAEWPWPLPPEKHPGYANLRVLSTTISRATLYSTGDRNTQPRGVQVASVETPFGPAFFMATHLTTFIGDTERADPSLEHANGPSQSRQHEVEQIIRVVNELRAAEAEVGAEPRPILLAGDFNAQPPSKEIQRLLDVFEFLPPTSKSGSLATHIKQGVQIDHILLSDPLKKLGTLKECFIYEDTRVNAVTDHRLVIVTFEGSAE